MDALVYDGDDDFELRDVPDPEVEEPTDAVLSVRAALSSGTDKHLFDDPVVEEGRVLGPEFVGDVAAVGSAVTSVAVGDRVVPSVMTHCGDCANCERGLWSNCVDGGWELGYTRDGGRAEYVRIRNADENLFHVPPEVSDPAAALAVSSLPTGWEAVERGRVDPGDSVAVVGAGAIGLCSVACARLYGPATVAVSDLVDSRLALAEAMGADVTVDADAADDREAFGRLAGGHGPDVVVEASGYEATYRRALEVVRPGGVVSLIAYHQDTYDMPFGEVWSKNVDLSMGYVDGTAVPTILDLLAKGKLSVDPVLTHEVDLADVESIDQLESPDRVKTVIRVD